MTSIANMGLLRKAQGKFAEAEVLFREAAEKNRRLRGEEHPETLISMMNLGGMLQTQGKFADAEAIFRDVLEKSRRVRGEGHPHTLTALSTLGNTIQAQGRTAEAEPFHLEALEKQRRYLGADHPTTLTGISNMGALRQAQRRLDEAEGFYREALEKRRRVLGEEHLMTMQSVTFLAGLHTIQGKHAEVVAMLAPMEARARKVFTGSNAWRLGFLLMNLGQARAGLAKEPADFAAAEANLLEAQGIYVKARGEVHKDTRVSAEAIADFYDARHKAEPGNGFDSKAAEWRKKLETMTPTEKKP